MTARTDDLLLRLTPAAINALFPEGTQARVDLQNAVLTETARRYVKRSLDDEARQHLDKLAADVALELDLPALIGQSFARKFPGSANMQLVPSSEMTKTIAVAVEKRFQEALAQRVDAEVEAALARAQDSMGARIERLVQIKVDQQVHNQMAERVNQAFAAAGLSINPVPGR